MSDTQLRSEIAAVLSKWDVVWRDDNLLTDDGSIQFQLNDKPVSVSYDPARRSGIPELLSAKLRELGATEKLNGAVVTTPDAPAEKPSPRTIQNQGKYTVYQSARVIAIELDVDLMIPKGHVLVIPLNRPNTLLDLEKEQFTALFSARPTEEVNVEAPPRRTPVPPAPAVSVAPASVAPPATVTLTDATENDVLAYLQQRNGGVKSAVIATSMGMTIKSVDQILKQLYEMGVAIVETGFWRLKAAPTPTLRPSAPVAPKPAPAPEQNSIRTRIRRPRSGVPPQLGRILVAMAYAAKQSGKADLTTQQVKPFLVQRDKHQYSARLPGAVKDGLVTRGLPLPDSRGWHYQLTAKGLRTAQEVGSDVFETDNEAVPAWMGHLND